MTRTQARKRFAKWVSAAGGQRKAAELLGCSIPMVSLVVNGLRNIGPLLYDVVEREVNIPAKAWRTG